MGSDLGEGDSRPSSRQGAIASSSELRGRDSWSSSLSSPSSGPTSDRMICEVPYDMIRQYYARRNVSNLLYNMKKIEAKERQAVAKREGMGNEIHPHENGGKVLEQLSDRYFSPAVQHDSFGSCLTFCAAQLWACTGRRQHAHQARVYLTQETPCYL